MKKRTSLYIDAELLELAKKNGVNMSKLLEEALKSLKSNAEGGIRTPESLRNWTLNPAPLSTRQPPLFHFNHYFLNILLSVKLNKGKV